MNPQQPRGDDPPLRWKIIAGLLVFFFVCAIIALVEWRLSPPPPPNPIGLVP